MSHAAQRRQDEACVPCNVNIIWTLKIAWGNLKKKLTCEIGMYMGGFLQYFQEKYMRYVKQ
jgi:hypothetical protein